MAEFFTRPKANPPLYGDVATVAPFWGVVNWEQRFVCSASPNMLYLNADGSANVDTEPGVRAFAELLRSLEWHPPKALEQNWFSQYQLMGAGSVDDPYVARSYKPQPTGAFKNIIPRTTPPITLKGAQLYRDSLSEELQKMLTKEQTPEQAAKRLQDRWDQITEEQGVETQVEALRTSFAGSPQITDEPDRELPVEEVSTAVS